MEEIQINDNASYQKNDLTIIQQKTGSRLIYAISLMLIMIAGTGTAIAGAFAVGIDSITDIGALDPNMPRSELEFYYYNLGKFATEHAKQDLLGNLMVIIAISGLLFIVGIILLAIQTGRFNRTEAGMIRLNFWDRIWTELHLIVIGVAIFVALRAAWLIYGLVPYSNWVSSMTPYRPDSYYYGISNNTVLALSIAILIGCMIVSALSYSAIIKTIKARELFRISLIGKILILIGVGAKYVSRGIRATGRGISNTTKGAIRPITVPSDEDRNATTKIVLKYVIVALTLILVPFFASVAVSSEVSLFFLFAACIIATILIVRKIRKLCEIRYGAIEVSSGNLAYKLDVNIDERGPKTDLDHLANAINKISEATSIAVRNEVKNQRLKTDLISNVSHDLKTPLTSMINYLDIIEKEGLDSPDALAHLAIVKEKTDRLRALTEELFEAAKASSGNVPCEIEDIDLVSIIDQTLAEMGGRLEEKGLRVIKNFTLDKPAVRADGKLLYRVLENMLVNISKYALENSRVYINVSEEAGTTISPSTADAENTITKRLLLEIKNISKDELNISADELMERFTRGDSSRNTEGSGLGLAIAKDLTRIMGGEFEIVIDGDMFKACILLEAARR